MQLEHVNGYNGDVDTGTEDIWSGGGGFPWPSAAAATKVNSGSNNDAAAGTGARTIRIIGLDAGFQVLEETVTLNGTNDVNCVNQYFRILKAYVLTAGSGGVNAGAISILQGVTLRAEIPTAMGRTQMAVFTAPLYPKVWMIKKIYAAAVNAVAGNVIVRLFTRKSGGAWQCRSIISVYGTTKSAQAYELESPIVLEPGEDVRLEATSGADNTAVTGTLELHGDSSAEAASDAD